MNSQKLSAGSDVGNKLKASERLDSPSDSESALTDAADGGLGGRGFGVGGDIRFLPTNSTYVPGKSPFSCRTRIKDRRCENHIKSATIIFLEASLGHTAEKLRAFPLIPPSFPTDWTKREGRKT